MDNLGIHAFPGDTVQLNGTPRTGEVLDWATQNKLSRRDMEATHLPIHSAEQSSPAFWPRDKVTVIKRKVAPPAQVFPQTLEDEFRF